MILLPQTTEFDRKIPKQTFYENIKISSAIKRIFIDEIKSIYWKNKISTATFNVEVGEKVEEIQILELQLYKPELDFSALQVIKNGIPYNIVFMLTCEDKSQLVVFHSKMFCTQWTPTKELQLEIIGTNLDDIWNNFVKQIGNIEIKDNRTLDEQIAENERVAKLQKEIEKLERMAKKEVQPKRKFELHQEILRLKEEF